MQLKKERSLFGRRFQLDMINDTFTDKEELQLILSILMANILERFRG